MKIDVLNVDDSRAPPQVDKIGTLTATTLRGLELPEGIDYAELEVLNLWLGFGDNQLIVNGTHPGETNIYAAQGDDTFFINDASGNVVVNGETGSDTFNVRGTAPGSTVVLNGLQGADVFHVSDLSPLLPATSPATRPSNPPTAISEAMGMTTAVSAISRPCKVSVMLTAQKPPSSV